MSQPLAFHRRACRFARTASRTHTDKAFTLIELLVSMAVLLLLVLAVSQLVNGASATTNLQRQQLDADRQARLVFDRMAADFNAMVRRADVDCSAYKYPNYRGGNAAATPPHFKRGGNDSLLFFAEADSQFSSAPQGDSQAASGTDSIALVGYRVFERNTESSSNGGSASTAGQNRDASFRLERLGRSFGWSGTNNPGLNATNGDGFGLPFLTFTKPTNPNTIIPDEKYQVVPNSTITTYWPATDKYNAVEDMAGSISESHVLGEDVFRLEFALVMKDAQPDGSFYLKGDGRITYLDYTVARHQAFQGVSAIVVTLATLDKTNRQRLGDGDTRYAAMSRVAGKLVDSDTPEVATAWTNTLLNKNNDSTIPRVFTTGARVYQRYFYLR